MSAKNTKCKLCGAKVKKGARLCKTCQAWEDAGNKPVFDIPGDAIISSGKGLAAPIKKVPVSQIGQALNKIFK